MKAERRLNPERLMATLDCLYPQSTHFSLNLNGRIFAAATPERLVTRRGAKLTCDAIGGTIDRAAEEDQDRRLGENLRSDPKAQHEHALVVRDIKENLQRICKELTIPSQPSLIRLRNLQHLWTRIDGELQDQISLLEIADLLHPTAAVNGFPSTEAGQWLRKHEAGSRGWFTGAAGWLDNKGDGELAVLLRCALLDDDSAELFAGAGVTSDSIPTMELHETELKLSTMLEALENA